MVDKLTLSVDETASQLGISRTLCFDLVKRGRIPSIRLGRRIVIPKSALQAFIEREIEPGARDNDTRR